MHARHEIGNHLTAATLALAVLSLPLGESVPRACCQSAVAAAGETVSGADCCSEQTTRPACPHCRANCDHATEHQSRGASSPDGCAVERTTCCGCEAFGGDAPILPSRTVETVAVATLGIPDHYFEATPLSSDRPCDTVGIGYSGRELRILHCSWRN